MPRKPKSTNLRLVADKPIETDSPAEPIVVETTLYPKVTFDGREFEIHPTSDRNDDGAYDDSAEFMVIVVPIATKIFAQLMSTGRSDELLTTFTPVEKQKPGGEMTAEQKKAAAKLQALQAAETIDIIASMDTGMLLSQVSQAFPKLAAIALHYTDPNITEYDVKAWTKNPFDVNMWIAVIEQIKADKILQQVGNLRGLLGEFAAA